MKRLPTHYTLACLLLACGLSLISCTANRSTSGALNSNLSKMASNAVRADAQATDSSPIQASNFTLQQCDSWTDLLQQPRIALGRQHSVRLGINMAGAQQLGMVQLFCLEYFNAEAGADADLAPLIGSGAIGPLEIRRPDEHILRDAMVIQREDGGPYFIYQYFIPAAPSKVLELRLADTLIAQANIPPINTHPPIADLNQHWYRSLINEVDLAANSEFVEEFDPTLQVFLDGLAPAVLGPPSHDPLFTPAPLNELTRHSFPVLNPDKLGRLACKALPKRSFQISIPKDSDLAVTHDMSRHFLARIWVNGKPFISERFGMQTVESKIQQLCDVQQSGSSFPIILQLKSPLPQIISSDLVTIQFLFSSYKNRPLNCNERSQDKMTSEPDVLLGFSDDLPSIARTFYHLSPVMTMQDPLIKLEQNFD